MYKYTVYIECVSMYNVIINKAQARAQCKAWIRMDASEGALRLARLARERGAEVSDLGE